MNIKYINNLEAIEDNYNSCWAITHNKYLNADIDVSRALEIDWSDYSAILLKYGAIFLSDNKTYVGFKTKEEAEKCVEVLKTKLDEELVSLRAEENLNKFLEVDKAIEHACIFAGITKEEGYRFMQGFSELESE